MRPWLPEIGVSTAHNRNRWTPLTLPVYAQHRSERARILDTKSIYMIRWSPGARAVVFTPVTSNDANPSSTDRVRAAASEPHTGGDGDAGIALDRA